jgi:hypothetical protein
VISGRAFFIIGQGGATVTVDGSPVNASPSPDEKTIRFVMAAHAVGKVDVTVTAPLSTVQASVPGGYTYVPLPPPVITEVRPNIGSTRGGTPVIITGTEFGFPLTVTIGGIVTRVEDVSIGGEKFYVFTPAHAAGTVEVIVTNPDGRTGSGMFTYASAATFDFNGDWQGSAQDLADSVSSNLVLSIRDNIVVSASCGALSLPLDPPPVVANGEFSFAGSGASASPAGSQGPATPLGRSTRLLVSTASGSPAKNSDVQNVRLTNRIEPVLGCDQEPVALHHPSFEFHFEFHRDGSIGKHRQTDENAGEDWKTLNRCGCAR